MEFSRDFTKILSVRLREKQPLIQIVTGPRQVGKTTGLKQLLERGQFKKYIFATADQLTPPDVYWLQEHWLKARALGAGAVLVIDEVQKIPRWSEAVKKLFDEDRGNRDLRIVLLGSSSLQLKRGLSESLAGRFEIIAVPHWSYAEQRKVFGFTLDQYLQFGGYPAFSKPEYINDLLRWQDLVRQSIIEPVLSRDIPEQVEINKPALFRQTFELAMGYPAQVIGFNKLLGRLQEGGNVTTMRNYLELFEHSFLLKLLQKFSGDRLRQRTSSPKIIPLAPALVHALHAPNTASTDAAWRGRVIEMAVGAHLSRTRGRLFYWQDGDFEVDFILQVSGQQLAIEVKSGRPRRSSSLGKFLKRYPKIMPLTIDQSNLEAFLLTEDVDTYFLDQVG